MGAILPILLALNILVASVATPTLVSGLGLGSGAAGSSFKKAISKSDSDIKAASTIFNLSCEKDIWNSEKTDEEPAYPQSPDDFKNLLDQAVNIGSVRFNQLCQAQKKGLAGIVFKDPLSGEFDNGVEMYHLFASHWDRRSLTAIYYLYQKRFSSKGYFVDCKIEDKTAPIMTLSVAAGYMDENGQPTDLGRSGFEDDKSVEDVGKVVSSHSRGQGVDIKTFGCTIITGDKPSVEPNQIAIGQDDAADLSELTAQALAAVVDSSAPASEVVSEGLAETKEDNPSFVAAGQDAGARAGFDPVAVAAEIPDPDAEPEIMIHNDPPADLEMSSPGATIPASTDQKTNKVPFEDRAAQMLERAYEKQQGLPAGSLRDGANLSTIGRRALYNQTGITLSEKPTSDELAAASARLAAYKNAEVAALVPENAIVSMRSGNYEHAFKLVGAKRINEQFNLGFSSERLSRMAESGLSGDDLVTYMGNNRQLSADEKEHLSALSKGGYKSLRAKLDSVQVNRDKSVSGELVQILKDNPALNQTQRLALYDFINKKEFRPQALQRLINAKAPQTLIDWANRNQNISDQDAKVCSEAYSTYSSSSDSTEALARAYPSAHEQAMMGAISLMKPEEKLIFQSVFGSHPKPKDLKEGFSNGKFKQASEAFVFSRALQRAGIPASQASYLAIGLAQDRMNSTDAGLARVNQEIGKKWNVTLTKDDLTLFKNGNFSGGKKLAIGAIASKTKLPIQKIFDYFDKKDSSSKNRIADAYGKGLTSEQSKNMLNGILDKETDGGDRMSNATAKAGAKAKAQAIATSSAEGENKEKAEQDRETIKNKLNNAFDKALDKAEASAKQEGKEVLIGKGLNNQEANSILDGNVKGAEKIVANAVVAKKIVSELPPGTVTVEGVKSVLNGKSTPQERDALRDNLITYELGQNGIIYSGQRSITDTLEHGSPAQREALMKDLGTQYGAFYLKTIAQENGIPISREQSIEFMNQDFSQLGNVAGQTVISGGISRLTGIEIPGEAASRIYDGIRDLINDSPKPATSFPSSSSAAQVGIGTNGSNSNDATSSQPGSGGITDLPNDIDAESGNGTADAGNNNTANEPPQGVNQGQSPNSAANQDAQAQGDTPQNRIENIGWGIVEDQLGFSREAITNLDDNIRNLPDNMADYYTNFDYSAALNNIATGVILNKLIGNTLAKIDPTGGILSCIAMQYAAGWVASLGISMPILLGISLLIDFKGTVQAIKGLVMMAFQIFRDPIGAIMGFLGFGKKKPKMQSAAKNAVKAQKEDSLDGRLVDAPIESPVDPNVNSALAWLLGRRVRAADDSDEPKIIPATSNYLAAKKPSEEQFKKISRRTTDQVIEDLLLFSLAASANPVMTKNSNFLKQHWDGFMDIENPQNKSYVIKQVASPRAVITDAEIAAAKKLGMHDVLYAKESSEPVVGYKALVNYARILYGDDFLPSTASKRVSGLIQNRSIKGHVHFAF